MNQIISVILVMFALGAGCRAADYTPTSVKRDLAKLGARDFRVNEKPGQVRPNVYLENVKFVIDGIAPRGGQILFCVDRKNGETLLNYYRALTGAFACPYTYISADGLVVVQLNNRLEAKQAKKFQKVVEALGG